jgi:hypothetical protein
MSHTKQVNFAAYLNVRMGTRMKERIRAIAAKKNSDMSFISLRLIQIGLDASNDLELMEPLNERP